MASCRLFVAYTVCWEGSCFLPAMQGHTGSSFWAVTNCWELSGCSQFTVGGVVIGFHILLFFCAVLSLQHCNLPDDQRHHIIDILFRSGPLVVQSLTVWASLTWELCWLLDGLKLQSVCRRLPLLHIFDQCRVGTYPLSWLCVLTAGFKVVSPCL